MQKQIDNYRNHVVRSPGGSSRRVEPLSSIQVPDLWHIAGLLKMADAEREEILETWHLAHDLLYNLRHPEAVEIFTTGQELPRP